MYFEQKRLERQLTEHVHRLVHELEEHKNRMMRELSGVDKVTLTKLREIVADYYKARDNISALAKFSVEEFKTKLTGCSDTAISDFEDSINGIINTAITNSNDLILDKIDEIISNMDFTGSVDESEIRSIVEEIISGMDIDGGMNETEVRTLVDEIISGMELPDSEPTSPRIWYGVTNTSATTSEKVVTTETGDFELKRGSILALKFLTDTYNCGSLIVDGTVQTGIKSANDENGYISSEAPLLWKNKGEILWFVFDGQYFILMDSKPAGDSTQGIVSLNTIRSEAAKNHYTKTEIDNKFSAFDTALAEAIGSGVIS